MDNKNELEQMKFENSFYINKMSFETMISSFYKEDLSFFLLNIEVSSSFSTNNSIKAENLLIHNIVEAFGTDVKIYKTRVGRYKVGIPNIKTSEFKRRLKEFLKSFKIPVKTKDGYVFVKIKVGVVYSAVKESVQKLVLRSRLALLYSKENHYAVYHKNMYKRYYLDLKLEELLYEAYNEDEFSPFFQAYVDSETKEVVGAEVLMRWIKSEDKIIPPILFIPILEKNKFIIEVELQFIKKLFNLYNDWKRKYKKEFPLSINISAVQLSNLNFIKEISKMVKDFKISPGVLTLEITESYIIENVESAASTLEKLKLLGFKISLDDFGTGYSTLTHLKSLPIDILKIDMIFVKNITTDKKSEIIVNQMIEMSKKLKIKVICEGIETEEQYIKLRDMGVDVIQGYYFAIPIPQDEFEDIYLKSDEIEYKNMKF